uniref:Uncharacterized protein n=1 Tax=Meloidogyne enterolobii TaxID=390850 RepID=A0A6V7WNU1_MELEN|nr:unnamed protein product [Meloidogyne enterolobii]
MGKRRKNLHEGNRYVLIYLYILGHKNSKVSLHLCQIKNFTSQKYYWRNLLEKNESVENQYNIWRGKKCGCWMDVVMGNNERI